MNGADAAEVLPKEFERLRMRGAVFFWLMWRQSTVIVDSGGANVLKYKILDSMIQERLNDV